MHILLFKLIRFRESLFREDVIISILFLVDQSIKKTTLFPIVIDVCGLRVNAIPLISL